MKVPAAVRASLAAPSAEIADSNAAQQLIAAGGDGPGFTHEVVTL